MALLDEAAELLGEDETAQADAAGPRPRPTARAEVEYAGQVQDMFGGADFGTRRETSPAR